MDARFIGYGAMLMESFVAIMALVAASIIEPGLYFAMNTPPSGLGITMPNLHELGGENTAVIMGQLKLPYMQLQQSVHGALLSLQKKSYKQRKILVNLPY